MRGVMGVGISFEPRLKAERRVRGLIKAPSYRLTPTRDDAEVSLRVASAISGRFGLSKIPSFK